MCMTPLYNEVKKFKKKSVQEKMDLAYCGNNDYRLCRNEFDPPPPPSTPALPPFSPLPPLSPDQEVTACEDKKGGKWCAKKQAKGLCSDVLIQEKCAATCGRICVTKGNKQQNVEVVENIGNGR